MSGRGKGGKGLGKGGAKRHRKVLRDNIQGEQSFQQTYFLLLFVPSLRAVLGPSLCGTSVVVHEILT